MRTIEAKILDSTHLELSEPVEAAAGDLIRIAIPEEGADTVWRNAILLRFLDAYAEEDSIYDDL